MSVPSTRLLANLCTDAAVPCSLALPSPTPCLRRYNYRKLQAMQQQAAGNLQPVKSDAQMSERTPLKSVDEEK